MLFKKFLYKSNYNPNGSIFSVVKLVLFLCFRLTIVYHWHADGTSYDCLPLARWRNNWQSLRLR